MQQYNPDYRGWDLDKVYKHFHERIKRHASEYQPIKDETLSYVRLLNFGQRVVVHNVHGYLQSRIVFFTMNMHNDDRMYVRRLTQHLLCARTYS